MLTRGLGSPRSLGLSPRPMTGDLKGRREVSASAIALQNLAGGWVQPFTSAIAVRRGAGACWGRVAVMQRVSGSWCLRKRFEPSCQVPDDCIDPRRRALFIGRETMRELIEELRRQ
ncbi:MAG: hypothetical protein DI596_10270, partial [Azospira oryzae]